MFFTKQFVCLQKLLINTLAPSLYIHMLIFQTDDDPPLTYSQTFTLKPIASSFYVQHDIFRLGLHDSLWLVLILLSLSICFKNYISPLLMSTNGKYWSLKCLLFVMVLTYSCQCSLYLIILWIWCFNICCSFL